MICLKNTINSFIDFKIYAITKSLLFQLVVFKKIYGVIKKVYGFNWLP